MSESTSPAGRRPATAGPPAAPGAPTGPAVPDASVGQAMPGPATPAPSMRPAAPDPSVCPDAPAGAPPTLGRRAVLAGAGAVTLGVAAACGSGTSSNGSDAAPGTVLGPVSGVPVGGGAIFVEQEVVVTQPAPGQFQGLSTVCPHQGCQVNSVRDGQVVCPCHGSRFGLDGAVLEGPAQSPLARRAVAVQGQNIVLA